MEYDMSAGKSAWREWEAFEVRARPLRERHAEVSRDRDLTPAARQERLRRIEQEFAELHAAAVANASDVGRHRANLAARFRVSVESRVDRTGRSVR